MVLARYAEIEDGICVNVIAFDPDNAAEQPPPSIVPIDDLSPLPWIGWSFDGSEWTPPVETE